MGALVQVWRGSMALLMWTVKLVRTRYSSDLPRSESHASIRGRSIWTLLTAGPRRARRQSHAALMLLAKFRHGPEPHSEWNLFLWRATFPLVSLVLLTLLCVAGQLGHTTYSLVVNPVWYLCNFGLVTTPFLLVFQFSGLENAFDAESQTSIWFGLAAVSVAISLVEWYMSMPASRYSWIVGNTLFGIVALGAVPLFFSIQTRTSRSQYEALVRQEQEQDPMHDVPEAEDAESDHETRRRDPRQVVAANTRSSGIWMVRGPNIQGQRQPTMTKLLYGCGFCALVLWLVMFCSYTSAQGGQVATSLWFLLYSMSPVLCVVFLCSQDIPVRFSFEHAVAYSALVVHIPLFLGHLCVRLFTLAEDPTATSPTGGKSWLKLAVSMLYLLLMQGYFFVITHMVNSMAEPFAHPSLLYVGQLYYYMYWYILVGTDTPIDGLYWAMLLLNNIHIAFLNTGIYTDFKRVSSVWLATPVQVHFCSSVAVCLRTTTSAMAFSKCLSQGQRLNEQNLQGLDCVAVLDTPSELLEGSSEGFTYCKVHQTSVTFGTKCSRAQSSCRKCSKSSQSNGGATAASTSDEDLRRATSDALRPLYFLMKLAEQDNMADTTALILVPSLLTLLAVFEKPGSALTVLQDQTNLWLRCVCMFIGRLGGAFLAREIFTCKLRSRLRPSHVDVGDRTQSDPIRGSIDGMPARLWIQRLMLQDFHAQFWYLTAVTIVITFGCFARIDLPLRFALL